MAVTGHQRVGEAGDRDALVEGSVATAISRVQVKHPSGIREGRQRVKGRLCHCGGDGGDDSEDGQRRLPKRNKHGFYVRLLCYVHKQISLLRIVATHCS